MEFEPFGHPVELLSLSGKLGAQVRATVSSFGPLLLGQDPRPQRDPDQRPVAGLQVLRRPRPAAPRPRRPAHDPQVPRLGRGQGRPRGLRRDRRRRPSGSSCARSSRLEQQGADAFFGEPAFEVEDLLRTGPGRAGRSSTCSSSRTSWIARSSSRTFMLWMLAQLYQALPEAGDLPKPKLVFFFDEAHLLFDGRLARRSSTRSSRRCGSSARRASASSS